MQALDIPFYQSNILLLVSLTDESSSSLYQDVPMALILLFPLSGLQLASLPNVLHSAIASPVPNSYYSFAM